MYVYTHTHTWIYIFRREDWIEDEEANVIFTQVKDKPSSECYKSSRICQVRREESKNMGKYKIKAWVGEKMPKESEK